VQNAGWSSRHQDSCAKAAPSASAPHPPSHTPKPAINQPPGDFFKFIGDTPKNPVNAALVNSPSDGKPGVAVPVKLYNGQYKDGKLSWTGQPLVSLSSIIAPGAKAAEKLKPGQSIEMKQPSLLIDGADGYKGPSVAARGRSGASDAFSTGRDTVNGALGDEEKAAAVDKDDVHGDVNARAEKWWSDNGRR